MDIPSSRHLFLIVVGTLLSSNCAIMLYQPSIATVILGVCTSIFVSKAFLACESISDNARKGLANTELASDEAAKKSEGIEVVELGTHRKTFVFRLRNISFLLATFSTVSLLTLNRQDLFLSLSGDWWKREAGVFVIESIRWIIIPFLVWPPRLSDLILVTEK